MVGVVVDGGEHGVFVGEWVAGGIFEGDGVVGFEVAGGVVEVSGGVEWVGWSCFEGDGWGWCDAHGFLWCSFVGFLGWDHIVGLLVGVAGDGVCCGCGVFWFVGEGTGVGFAGCGFEGDGALGGAVGVGGFGAAVGDLAVVDEVFVGGGGGVSASGEEGEGEEEGGECGFGVHGGFPFSWFLVVPTIPFFLFGTKQGVV